jgi:hypothetical protein
MSRLICLLMLAALPVAAQQPLQAVVPYTGHLDFNGQPFDGVLQMRFSLFDLPEGGAPLWQELHPRVQVNAGTFSARLGAPVGEGAVAVAIAHHIQQNRQHFLQIEVSDTPEGEVPEWTPLHGRQAIAPVPVTLWTAQRELDVQGLVAERAEVQTLEVRGSLTNGGAPVGVEGDLEVAGDLIARDVRGSRVLAREAAAEALEVTGETNLEGAVVTEGGLTARAPNGRPVIVAEGPVELQAVRVQGEATFAGRVTLSGATTIDTLRADGLFECDNFGPLGQDECGFMGPSGTTHVCYLTRVSDYRPPLPGSDYLPGHCSATIGAQGRWFMLAQAKQCTWQCLRIRP